MRKLKRVPLDFDWPLKEVWKGYINPYSKQCPGCNQGKGITPAREWLNAISYVLPMAGAASLETESLHPWLKAIRLAPDQRPGKEMALLTEGLAGNPPRYPFGHSGTDHWHASEKIIQAAGLDPEIWGICPVCHGHGIDPEVYEKAKAWEAYEPPAGEGYQLWEDISEGSPVSPVFETLDKLCFWLEKHDQIMGNFKTFAEWKSMIENDCVYHQVSDGIIMI